ncbi:ribose 5-phosphate isomerase A-domain-containing protein [Globomyces pollinis-pini]|nr:ribose 5-phosphate isomerase A-domain-containing protein [Globomyces pollinis-pini]
MIKKFFSIRPFHTKMSDLLEIAKSKASFSAVDQQVSASTKVIGIGSGSTVVYAVQRLGERYKAKEISPIACIPSSFQAQQLIVEHGLPLGTLNQYPEIDVAFDGADEVDPQFNCIKGGGGCHLQEKLVIANSKKFFIVADYRKDSEVLGKAWQKGVPIETVPLAYVSVMKKLTAMGGSPKLRMAVNKAGPVVTDNGNFIVDVNFDTISDPKSLDIKLQCIPGIVETGLFCGLADGAYFGLQDGTVNIKMK